MKIRSLARNAPLFCALLVACACAAVGRGEGVGASPETVLVGVGRVDVTPVEPIRLAGYGDRRVPADSVAQRLWATALALGGEGEGPAVLVTADLVGIPLAVSEEVARRLERVGVSRERLVVAVTHTHTGPSLAGVLPGIFPEPLPPEQEAVIRRFTESLVAKLEQAALAALADRRPALVGWTQGRAGFAANRRMLREGRWTGFGFNPDGPVDHDLPVLRVAEPDGRLRAVLVGYASHATTLLGRDNFVHGDWPGAAKELIEARHPGAVALVTIGAGADADPRPRGNGIPDVLRNATEIADEVDRLLAGGFRPITAAPTGRYRLLQLPFDSAAATAPYPVQTWTFGDELAMVFLAGEVVVDYGRRLEGELDASRLWVTAYANDVSFYVASRRVLAEGGYEADRSMVYYGQPSRLAPAAEDLIVRAVRDLLPGFSGGATGRAPAPAGPR